MFFPEIMVKQVLYYWRPCSSPQIKSNYQNQFHVTWKCMVELHAPLPWCVWKKKWKVEGTRLLGVGGELYASI